MTSIRFVPPRVPLVDARSGNITREWYRFLQTFFDPSTVDAETDLILSAYSDSADAHVPQVALDMMPVIQPSLAVDDVAPVIAILAEQIAELTKAVNDLKLGAIVL